MRGRTCASSVHGANITECVCVREGGKGGRGQGGRGAARARRQGEGKKKKKSRRGGDIHHPHERAKRIEIKK